MCTAKANYGGIEVDWDLREIHMYAFSPFETQQEGAHVVLDLDYHLFQ